MNRLFDLDNGFFRFMEKLFDLIVLNILTLLLCVPIVTAGPAITALYYVAMKIVRDEEGYVFKDFFKSFKQNFNQGFVIELILVACVAFLTFDINVTYQWMNNDGGLLVRLLFFALVGLALVVVVTAVYVFPVLAKFDNTVKKVIINSAMMATRHLSFTILMIVIYVAMGVAIYIYPITLFFIVGFAAGLNSIILRKIFDNYIQLDSQGKVVVPEEVEVRERSMSEIINGQESQVLNMETIEKAKEAMKNESESE